MQPLNVNTTLCNLLSTHSDWENVLLYGRWACVTHQYLTAFISICGLNFNFYYVFILMKNLPRIVFNLKINTCTAEALSSVFYQATKNTLIMVAFELADSKMFHIIYCYSKANKRMNEKNWISLHFSMFHSLKQLAKLFHYKAHWVAFNSHNQQMDLSQL